MQYTHLGQTGLVVSRLAFGAMTFSSGNRDIPALFKVDESIADRLVGMALDAGVNFFDTADVYARGQSEEILGRALADRRKDVIISTKCGGRAGSSLNDAGLSRRHILESVDSSLKRLGTDYIDVYIVHREDPFTPMEETLSALDAVVRAGKVLYLGFSNWSAWRVATAMEIMKANGLARFTHGQMYYSLVCRDVEQDVIPMMRHFGLGLTTWSPLAGGFLSGKYRRGKTEEEGTRFAEFETVPIDRDRAYDVIEKLVGMAAKRSVSVAQIALAWLLAKSAVTSVILGAAKPDQLQDNLGAADVALTDAEVEDLDESAATRVLYPHWFLQRHGDRRLEKALSG